MSSEKSRMILAVMAILITLSFFSHPVGAKAQTDLTFTFNSVQHPWTDAELAALKSWTVAMYPLVRKIYGPPAFSNVVNIRKDAVEHYDDNLKEIVLPGAIPDVLVHEMAHSFRGSYGIVINAWEEGMAKAAEVWVMSQLKIAGYTYWDTFNSDPDDVWYAPHNTSAISGMGCNFSLGAPLTMVRKQQAGYAWMKCLLEDLQFLSKFNAAYYVAAKTDSVIACEAEKLEAIAAKIKPSVEGLPFAPWYAAQKIFDFNPTPGYQFLLRDGNIFYAYFRDANGYEHPTANAVVTWDYTDCRGYTLGNAGAGVTSQSGWINIPTPQTSYTGKVGVQMTISTPDGVKPVSFISFAGTLKGIFGTVPTATGTVKIMPPKGASVIVSVVNGSYAVPDFAGLAGKFTISFTPPGKGVQSKIITKNGSDYYVPF